MKALAGLGALGMLGVALYAVFVEPYALGRHDLTVEIPGLDRSFEGYRILHLSDLESSGVGRRERRVADITRDAHPDLVVVTGDLVRKSLYDEEAWSTVAEIAAYLGGLRAADGVWFVQGHGELAGRLGEDRLREVLSRAGVRTLFNEVALLTREGGQVALAGIRVHDYGTEGKWEILPSGLIRQGPGKRPTYLELVASGSSASSAAETRPATSARSDREITGRVRFSSPDDWVGFLLHSRLSAGSDRLYMVVKRDRPPFLGVQSHGTGYRAGLMVWDREMAPSVWHRFKVQVKTTEDRVTLAAKAWPEAEPEPVQWDLTAEDSSATRIESGEAGLYAEGPGVKEFDDVRVVPAGEGKMIWREPEGADFLLDLIGRVPPGTPMILLSHTPDIFPVAAELKIALTLAGHTQGGQIRLPFFGALTTDTHLGRRFSEGLFTQGGSSLFITRGVGTTRIPARFLCPPEVALITLRCAPS